MGKTTYLEYPVLSELNLSTLDTSTSPPSFTEHTGLPPTPLSSDSISSSGPESSYIDTSSSTLFPCASKGAHLSQEGDDSGSDVMRNPVQDGDTPKRPVSVSLSTDHKISSEREKESVVNEQLSPRSPDPQKSDNSTSSLKKRRKRKRRTEASLTLIQAMPSAPPPPPPTPVIKLPERVCKKKRRYAEIVPDGEDVSEYYPSDSDESEGSRYTRTSERKRCKIIGRKTSGNEAQTHIPSLCPAYRLGCTSFLTGRVSDSFRHFESTCKFNIKPEKTSEHIVRVETGGGCEEVIHEDKVCFIPILNPAQYSKFVLKRVDHRCICGRKYKREDAVRRHQRDCQQARAQKLHRKRRDRLEV